MSEIYHALGLHLHQPPGNMMEMLRHAENEATLKGVEEVIDVSRRYWQLEAKVKRAGDGEARGKLERARKLILEAETSCFLFWGDRWVPRLYERTGPARELLGQLEATALPAR